MTVSWNVRPQDIWGALVQQRIDALEADIVALTESLLDQIQSYMRREAPWTDRTGFARSGLYTDIEHDVREAVRLLMSHGPAVWYSVFLEYAHGGRFAILGQTSDHFWPIFYRGVTEIVRQHSG